ncbi:SdpI/YhfL family protein [Lutibacter sp. Hel_I_33_5]|uniref:SdpI family protein n=1 Tax=Lutibacter sp. Hel_I_33_5 TaxID=1566289 RepID=UPI0011A22246|nr:SdpI family protein [Lutibacter sp. Hel_I_33_5]TVZ56212.1 SdpI/YhfL family protein [Lutibacter sp. Hel_I_33_5]
MNPYIYVLNTNGILFLLSIIFYIFPPKKINNLYGYRTHRSMLNEDIWNFANTLFNKTFMVYAGVSFLAGILFAYLATKEITWQPMVLVLLTILVCIIKTEKGISNTFNEEGKRK